VSILCEACLPAGRDLPSNGIVIPTPAEPGRNLLNKVYLVQQILRYAQDRDGGGYSSLFNLYRHSDPGSKQG